MDEQASRSKSRRTIALISAGAESDRLKGAGLTKIEPPGVASFIFPLGEESLH
jgi:hypothetical protein